MLHIGRSMHSQWLPFAQQKQTEGMIQVSIGQQNRALARRLDQLHVPSRIDLYGDGTHNWVYWQRELHRAWPMITAALMQKPG